MREAPYPSQAESSTAGKREQRLGSSAARTWEHCTLTLHRAERGTNWRGQVPGPEGPEPLVGLQAILAYCGSAGWELVSLVPLDFGADAQGLFLTDSVAVLKRPFSLEEALRTAATSLAGATT